MPNERNPERLDRIERRYRTDQKIEHGDLVWLISRVRHLHTLTGQRAVTSAEPDPPVSGASIRPSGGVGPCRACGKPDHECLDIVGRTNDTCCGACWHDPSEESPR